MIGKEIRSPLRIHLGLILHILPATGNKERRCETGESSSAPRNPARRSGG
jgi:hypothetical protein